VGDGEGLLDSLRVCIFMTVRVSSVCSAAGGAWYGRGQSHWGTALGTVAHMPSTRVDGACVGDRKAAHPHHPVCAS